MTIPTRQHRWHCMNGWTVSAPIAFEKCGMRGEAMPLLHMATQAPSCVESMILMSPTTHYAKSARATLGAVDPEKIREEEWDSKRRLLSSMEIAIRCFLSRLLGRYTITSQIHLCGRPREATLFRFLATSFRSSLNAPLSLYSLET